MSDREEIRSRMSQDGIEFLLAQFVDIHGSAKVKMVPVSSLDAAIDELPRLCSSPSTVSISYYVFME